jgi:DNA-binding SARP family transcriptional activator
VVWQGSGYALTAPADAVDVWRFEQLAVEGRAALREGDATAAGTALRSALDLWRGPHWTGSPTHSWLLAEVARLEHLRLDVVEDQGEVELALGLHAELVGELEALVASILPGAAVGQLMVALYRCGRQADALASRPAGPAVQQRPGAVTGLKVLVHRIWSRYPPFCSP